MNTDINKFKIPTEFQSIEPNIRAIAPVDKMFLKGPIPLTWLQNASKCSGRSLHVGVVLWFYSGMIRTATVPLNLSRLVDWGIPRDAARRALVQLERAGLVTVDRGVGRKPSVTIIRQSGGSNV